MAGPWPSILVPAWGLVMTSGRVESFAAAAATDGFVEKWSMVNRLGKQGRGFRCGGRSQGVCLFRLVGLVDA